MRILYYNTVNFLFGISILLTSLRVQNMASITKKFADELPIVSKRSGKLGVLSF